jgi:GAF domain-containing protein
MEHQSRTMADALAQAAREINDFHTLQETLDAIVHATRISVPAFDHVSISVRRSDGEIETRSGNDQLVWELDAVQYDLKEGPCVDAIEHGSVVVVENLPHESRWPRYIPAARQKGVRSQIGIQLFTGGKHVAGLNLYNTQDDSVEQESVDTARLFATHASIALGHAQETHHLNQALATRKSIGQAIGILMERYQIDEDRAFQFLMRASSTSNIKLRTVAEEVVVSSTERYGTAPGPNPAVPLP